MNEILITNFNKCVNKNDTVYSLGDIAHRIPVAEVNQMIARLNGKKIMCKGNHDKRYDMDLFEMAYDFLEIAVHGINISLMHYPMMSWPKSRQALYTCMGIFIAREITIYSRKTMKYSDMM